MKTICALLSIIIAIWAASESSVSAENEKAGNDASASLKWQHLALQHDASLPFNEENLSKQIIKLGNNGWELVTVLNFTKSGTTTETVYYFKKPG